MKKELEFHAGALPDHANPDDEAERLPLNYLVMLYRYKWRLIAGGLIGIVLGHLLYMKAGPEFEAFSEIMVRPKYAPPMREDDKMLSRGPLPSEHIKLILSPMIANEAVKIGNLGELPTFRGESDLCEVVLDSLKVKRVAGQDRSQMNVFDLRYTSKNADDATKVLEAVIESYQQMLSSSSDEQSHEVQKMAKQATKAMFDRLKEKEREYSEFIQSVPSEFRSALGTANQQVQTQTNVAPQDMIHMLGETRNRNRIKMAELRSRQQSVMQAVAAGESRDALEHQIRRFLNTTDGGIGQNQNKATEIGVYQTQLIPLILKEKELERKFGRDYPELKTVRQSIEVIVQTYRKLGVQLPEGISKQLDPKNDNPGDIDLVALYLAEVKQQLIELQIQDDQLEKLISDERNKSRVFAEYQTQEQTLRAEKESVLELWTKQLEYEEKVAIEKDSNGYRMAVLSPVKHGLVLKRMLKFYAAGAAMCLFLVAVTCVLQELADLTIKTVRDVRGIMRHPVLGSVCSFEVPIDRAAPNSGVPHPALRYLHAPSSVEAETYRTIRASLLVASENMGAKTIIVSSPEPGDGKTTLVSNLSVALAQSGKRVLLIDGDLRRPAVHQILRIPQGLGLSEVLLGTAELHDVIRSTVVERLSVMTTGTPPANPAETLSSPRFHDLIQAVRNQFDFILVDAPPLLAVSDTSVMARNTDGLLLVVRINKNSRSALIRVRELLNDQDIPVIGAVVNGVPAKGGHEYGYTYYGEYATPAAHQNAFADKVAQPEYSTRV